MPRFQSDPHRHYSCLEKGLWAAADQLRANSGLNSQQYGQPVLGLIFLRFAEVRFLKRRAELEKQAETTRSSRRSLGAGGRVDDPTAVLYVRDWEDGPDSIVPRAQWRFAREAAGGRVLPSLEHVYLESGFEPGRYYNLVYTAESACVVGAGLIAFRDIASFLRGNSSDNPLAGHVEWAYGLGISQTGRMLRHFLYLRLNVHEAGRQVYDGLLPHVAGARRGEFNHRCAQPSVQTTAGFAHSFPFADDELRDPLTG